jgi:hypothetical protein
MLLVQTRRNPAADGEGNGLATVPALPLTTTGAPMQQQLLSPTRDWVESPAASPVATLPPSPPPVCSLRRPLELSQLGECESVCRMEAPADERTRDWALVTPAQMFHEQQQQQQPLEQPLWQLQPAQAAADNDFQFDSPPVKPPPHAQFHVREYPAAQWLATSTHVAADKGVWAGAFDSHSGRRHVRDPCMQRRSTCQCILQPTVSTACHPHTHHPPRHQ